MDDLIASSDVSRELRALAEKVIEIWGNQKTTNTIVAALKIGATEVDELRAELTQAQERIAELEGALDRFREHTRVLTNRVGPA